MTSKAEDDSSCDAESGYDDVSLESLGAHLFFGDVNSDTSHAACEFVLKRNMFQPAIKPITIFFNTGGGEAADGWALIDVMETSRLPIASVGIGTICSMGVLLISAGTHGLRTLTRNSEVMAHQFAGYFSGKQHELVATQVGFKLQEHRFMRHFKRHTKMSDKQIKDVLFGPSDRYLTPLECKKYGLIDHIVEYADIPSIKKVRAPRSKL